MEQNRAAWLPYKKARPVTIKHAPMPTPEPDQVIVRVRAVAINPADNAVQTLGIVYENYPVIIGCDAAGDIVNIGAKVKGYAKGDRVTVSLSQGAFQHYCAVKIPFAAKIPDHVSYTDACVLPLALLTSLICLFESDMLGLDHPQVEPAKSNGKILFIWGGSAALGSCAIQMAAAAGYEVATTASAHNTNYCKRLGATHVFDYKSPDVVPQIIEKLKGKHSAGVFCAVTGEDVVLKSAQIADQLSGNKFVSILYPPFVDVQFDVPDGVRLGRCYHSQMDRRDVAKEIFGKWLPAALANGTMKCAPEAEIVGKGLDKIQTAMDKLAQGVSAKKIVVELP